MTTPLLLRLGPYCLRAIKPPSLAAFSFLAERQLRTIAYIDGYNLYYGCLRRTPYKWLDIVKFCNALIRIQNPKSELVKVKFFTADIKSRFSRHGAKALSSQNAYHRALQHSYPSQLQIVKGYHISEPTALPLDQKPFDLNQKALVLRIEEKLTDVSIATHMIEDAVIECSCDQVVLFSSDTDLAPALEMIKRHKADTIIGIVLPRRQNAGRAPNVTLSSIADWTRRTLRDEEFEAAQLPDSVPTRKKPAVKPDYW